MRLKNKVAIVSGGSRDIGRAVSLQLAKEGAKVVVNYFDSKEQADDTLKLIQDLGGEAIAVKADMTKAAEVETLVAEARKAFGDEINVLVNVVGGLVARKTTAEMDEDFWDFVMNVNLKSVFLAVKSVSPFMPAGSSIVNFSSLAARDGGGPGASAYATSKGAVMTYTRSLAKEFGPKGIRVNALAPGMIATTFHDTFTKSEVRTNVANATALKREGDAKEVADVVAYLASDESSFLTGNNIDINGGLAFS
ncbi:3-oxoacyl-[acyl-carrier-protein] reductase FabG [compost metagenome]|uniref:3-oxoacyl-[acyl-carrier protein] reductase n=1 Tax=Pedobacter xixiisoli TaxID=1476464 RepID=A0A285ZZ39_9SPHI|nr:SDR family oxidoreductase [Pedobacter xixiisoli]SOD14903.1 3-oxoacyl-[acyl-carrier protein] reductase [Pedobacter xixiisoli]